MEVVPDPQRGHIALVVGSATVGSLVESGDTLALWQTETVEMNPNEARDLARALYEWANRRYRISVTRGVA